MREMAQGKCIQTAHSNFFKVTLVDTNGAEVEYEVFFRIWKLGKGKLQLHVESAYVRDDPRQRPKGTAVGFFVILHNTLRGLPIRRR